MELMQLEIFLAVAEERNLRKAADRVFRTQPALSIALRKLEDEVGVLLLERPGKNGWNLTQAGRLLYDYASQMIRMRDEVVALLNGRPQYCRGRLCIGTYPAESLGSISKLTEPFTKKHPNTNLQLICDSESNLLGGVRDGRIDLAFLPAAPAETLAGNDLETASLHRSGRGPSFWIVHRRIGQSELARTFGQMLQLPTLAPSKAESVWRELRNTASTSVAEAAEL